MSIALQAKYPLFLSILNKLEFFERFSENTQMWNLMKIRPVEEEFFDADRRTDGHDEANSRFSQFCETTYKRTNKESICT
jgi:hypothetical protein